VLQHAAAQQYLSKASPNNFFLSEKEKIFNTKAMVPCKRSATVVKKMTSKTKKQTEVASGQSRRQKVVNRGILRLCGGGLYIRAGGA